MGTWWTKLNFSRFLILSARRVCWLSNMSFHFKFTLLYTTVVLRLVFWKLCFIFFPCKQTLFFTAISGSQKNWVSSTESSHVSPVLRHCKEFSTTEPPGKPNQGNGKCVNTSLSTQYLTTIQSNKYQSHQTKLKCQCKQKTEYY